MDVNWSHTVPDPLLQFQESIEDNIITNPQTHKESSIPRPGNRQNGDRLLPTSAWVSAKEPEPPLNLLPLALFLRSFLFVCLFLQQHLFLAWNLPSRGGWLVRVLRGPSVSAFPVLGLQAGGTMTDFFPWVLEMVFMPERKHFTI